jgi:hypothetical protein
MSKLSGMLYNISRLAGKTASTITDVETVLSGNPEKIIKRAGRKTIYKHTNKTARKINRNLFK